MEPAQAKATPPAVPSSAGLFGTKIPASAAFLVVVLLFLLPFAEVRCNGTALASNTGLGIAMGSAWKEVASRSIFGNNSDTTTTHEEKNQKQDPNIFAIAALGLGVLGLLIAFLGPRGAGKINTFIAILGAISLIVMLFDLKSKAKSDNSLKSSDLGINAGVSVTVEATAAFYFAVILFLLAALFSWQRSRVKTG